MLTSGPKVLFSHTKPRDSVK